MSLELVKTADGKRFAFARTEIVTVVETDEHVEVTLRSGRVMRCDLSMFDMLVGAPRRAKAAKEAPAAAPAATSDTPAEAKKPAARRPRAPKPAAAEGDKPAAAAPAAEGVEKKKRAPRAKKAPEAAVAAP